MARTMAARSSASASRLNMIRGGATGSLDLSFTQPRDVRVVMKVAANARELMNRRDPQGPQLIRFADARQHQKMGRVVGAPAQHDLPTRARRLQATKPPIFHRD